MDIEEAIKAFNPADPKHVQWFKETLFCNPGDEAGAQKLIATINRCPFGIRLGAHNFTMLPMVHGMLAIAYCKHAMKN